MCRFERRNNSFDPREQLRGSDRFFTPPRRLFPPTRIREPRMLWPDRRVIKARGYRVRRRNLPIAVLQHVRIRSLQHAWARARKTSRLRQTRRMLPKTFAASAGFNANHFYSRITQERMEQADCIRTAAHARK